MRRARPTNIINRLFSLAILFGLAALVLLTPVFERGLSGGQATFCLGFILLFGYYLAKLLEGFHLPAITSYIGTAATQMATRPPRESTCSGSSQTKGRRREN